MATKHSRFTHQNLSELSERLRWTCTLVDDGIPNSSAWNINIPAKLMLGRDLCLPIDLLTGRPNGEPDFQTTNYARNLQKSSRKFITLPKNNIMLKSDRMKEYYDTSSKDEAPAEGDTVWLHKPTRKKGLTPKLMRPWQGPYIIVRNQRLGLPYPVGTKCKLKVVHKNRLWWYTGNNAPKWDFNSHSTRTCNLKGNSI